MRTEFARILAVAAALASFSVPAAAQTGMPAGALPRADVSATLGWFNVRKAGPEHSSDDWANRIGDFSAGGGWYWTDNLKTQVDFGATTRTERYSFEQLVIDGRPTYQASETTFSSHHLAIGQHYQFFRNQWVHPRVGAGVDIMWERSQVETQPAVFFDLSGRRIELRPGRTEGPSTKTIARPFVEMGYKAYMTRRAFFTNDLRLAARNGRVDNAILRFGFGVDF